MDNSGEKVVSILEQQPDWSTIIDNTATQPLKYDGVQAPKESLMKIMMEIVEQEGFQPMWNKIMVLACVIAVSMDPLFLYIPTINEELKCFELDKKLRVLALVWRSIFDLIYIMDIVYNIAKAYKVEKREELPNGEKKIGFQLVNNEKISWYLIVVDLLSTVPVPQVIILVQLSKLRGMGSLEMRKYLNIILFSQYVPRVLRIYLSCKELTLNSDKLSGIVWVRGVFNLFLYILASHVFGAFWYFLSFQRETTCWHKACENDENCQSSTHSCTDKEVSINIIQTLNSSCPIKKENADHFDFGIFLEALQSGVLAPNTDFPQKLFHCFWWGLRNMSSLGQNLQTSTYVWETLFAVSISLCGLLLFLYLIGNLQTYMQLATTRSEEIREKMKLKERDIELWISQNGLPKHMKRSIMKCVKYKLQEHKDVDVENLFSILPLEERRSIKHLLCLSTITMVPMLEGMNEQVLKVICDHLKPVIYIENSYIIREGDPLDRMLFITQGTAWEYYSNEGSTHGSTHGSINDSSINICSSRCTRRIKKGDYFGEELVKWSLTHTTISDFPLSVKNLKSHTKVEAFALMANDLMNALRKHWWLFRRNLSPNSSKFCAEQWEVLALQALQKIRLRNQLRKKPSSSPQLPDHQGETKWKRYTHRQLHH